MLVGWCNIMHVLHLGFTSIRLTGWINLAADVCSKWRLEKEGRQKVVTYCPSPWKSFFPPSSAFSVSPLVQGSGDSFRKMPFLEFSPHPLCLASSTEWSTSLLTRLGWIFLLEFSLPSYSFLEVHFPFYMFCLLRWSASWGKGTWPTAAATLESSKERVKRVIYNLKGNVLHGITPLQVLRFNPELKEEIVSNAKPYSMGQPGVLPSFHM